MQNYFEVNGVTKNTQGDILYVGRYTSYTDSTTRTNYAIATERAIALIERGSSSFWVVDGINKQAIAVVTSGTKKYLRTHKDGKRTNNLDNLPLLPNMTNG